MKFVDREPVAAVSLALGLFGFSLPLIVPPIRESFGYTTKQVPPVLVFLILYTWLSRKSSGAFFFPPYSRNFL